jgi:hypothetical protein
MSESLSAEQRKKAQRAQERRYGQSMLPYRFKQIGPSQWRVIDDENGAFTDFSFGRNGRLFVTYHDEPAASLTEAR